MADHDMDLYLVVFDEKSFNLSSELYGDIDAYINDNYVEEKAKEEYLDYDAMEYERRLMSSNMAMAGSALHQPSIAKSSISPKKEKKKKRKLSPKRDEAPAYGAALADEATDMVCAMPMEADRSLDDVVKNLDKTFMELVFSFADEKGMTDVEVQKKANLDRKAFSKLKCGTTKNPSKSTALALAVALELSLDDTKDLLSRAGLALSPCSKQDLIVQYFIEREAYDIYAINIALFEHGEQLLGTQAS